jgi:hypothetical protein
MEDVLLPVDDQSVPCVVSALESDNEIRPLRKQIDNLALSLIAPLGAYYNYFSHFLVFPSSCIVRPYTRSRRKDAFTSFPLKDRRDDWPGWIYGAGFLFIPVAKIYACVKKKKLLREEFSPWEERQGRKTGRSEIFSPFLFFSSSRANCPGTRLPEEPLEGNSRPVETPQNHEEGRRVGKASAAHHLFSKGNIASSNALLAICLTRSGML